MKRVVAMRIGLFLILLLPNLVWAASKPVLRIVAPEIPEYTNADGTGTYWNIIKAVYRPHYQLKLSTALPSRIEILKQEQFADAFLVIDTTDLSNDGIYSQHYLDKRYPLHLLYKKDADVIDNLGSLTNKIIATTSDIVALGLLPHQSQIYQVKSIANTFKLAQNKRVDVLLTHSYNVHLADPQKQLVSKELIPAQKVRLHFPKLENNQRLANEFDAGFSQLLANNDVRQYFNKEADYLHANFKKVSLSQTIDWHLIPKKYGKDSKQLEAVAQEVSFSNYVDKQLPEFNLALQVNSSRLIFPLIEEQENQCVLNVHKKPEREQIAYFSKPSYVFLAPRLITLAGSEMANHLNQGSDAAVSLERLLTQSSSFRIAIVDGGNTEKTLSSTYGEAILNNLVKIKDTPLNSILPLLLNKRVDAVIAWPSHIPNILADSKVANTITTFTLDKLAGQHQYSYIACSKSPKGREFIDKLNAILADEQHLETLFGEMINEMDSKSAEQFMRLIKQPL